ncbi:MAG: hypothetical protein RL621_1490 [Bacteroidota bacterium]|jgi:hypothetical protein
MNAKKTITAEVIEKVLNTNLSEYLKQRCIEASLDYEEISSDERDKYILDVVNVLFRVDVDRDTKPAGEHRLTEWERGWGENLEAIKSGKSVNDLVPRYHGKHSLIHWNQQMIRPLAPFFDYKLHCIIVDWAIEKYLSNVDNLFEFGCGPGYHLLRARKINSHAKMIGLDWTTASQEIIKQIKENGIEKNIEGENFNFFKPNYSIEVPSNSGFLTVAALEQIGDKYKQFVDFILEKKPSICVHLEPIDELLDQNNLIDRLSTLYFRKRNYLYGYLPYLRQLQEEGKIKIVNEQRTFSGSYFIEGHSLIVWYPL